MTHQSPIRMVHAAAGDRLAQLADALALVAELAGGLDYCALPAIGDAYERAEPVARKRFDALAGETAGWVAAAIEALLADGDGGAVAPAARALAADLDPALRHLAAIVGRDAARPAADIDLPSWLPRVADQGASASAAERSAMRSSASSNPIWNRTSDPA